MNALVETKVHSRGGFTIVELLIVVVVIAILATITIISFNGIRQRAAIAATRTDAASSAKSLENQKVTSTSESYTGAILQYLSVDNNQTTIKYKYGDKLGFCMEAVNKNDPTITYYITSKDGISNSQAGTCPTPASAATTTCVAGKVVVVVNQTNDTTYDVIMNNTSIYGQNTSTTRTPGQLYSVATTSNLTSIPAGFTTTYIRGTNGSTYYAERYHAYEAKTCP
ncbi:MAG: prepilin-type N-terminal cleavage/methylation domain-containing protein [Candidatus Microsaccharimonas sp.]